MLVSEDELNDLNMMNIEESNKNNMSCFLFDGKYLLIIKYKYEYFCIMPIMSKNNSRTINSAGDFYVTLICLINYSS